MYIYIYVPACILSLRNNSHHHYIHTSSKPTPLRRFFRRLEMGLVERPDELRMGIKFGMSDSRVRMMVQFGACA